MAKKKSRGRPNNTRSRENVAAPGVHVADSNAVFLHALEAHRGDSTKACEAVGLDHAGWLQRMRNDAQFKEQCSKISLSFYIGAQRKFLLELKSTRDLFAACRVSGIGRELAYRRRCEGGWFHDSWNRIEAHWETRLMQHHYYEELHIDRDVAEQITALLYRIRDPVAKSRAEAALSALRSMDEEWVLRAKLLSRLGIPATSVDEDFSEWNPPRGRRGGHSEGGAVEYARRYLIQFVVYRWEPKGAVKSRRT